MFIIKRNALDFELTFREQRWTLSLKEAKGRDSDTSLFYLPTKHIFQLNRELLHRQCFYKFLRPFFLSVNEHQKASNDGCSYMYAVYNSFSSRFFSNKSSFK